MADVQALPAGKSTLTVFTNENGGIIDDSVITRVSEDELYIVTNAGCREKDIAHISKHIEDFKKSGGQVGSGSQKGICIDKRAPRLCLCLCPWH